MVSETTRILEGALGLIRDKNNWTRNFYALDKDGHSVAPSDPKAKCWCAEGAVMRSCRVVGVNFGYEVNSPHYILGKAIDQFPHEPDTKWISGVINFNDVQAHEDVVAVFESAIGISKQPDLEHQNGE